MKDLPTGHTGSSFLTRQVVYLPHRLVMANDSLGALFDRFVTKQTLFSAETGLQYYNNVCGRRFDFGPQSWPSSNRKLT